MSEKIHPIDVSGLPYPERQMIVVQADEIVIAERQTKTGSPPNTGLDWKTVASIAGSLVIGGRWGLIGSAIAAAEKAYEAWRRVGQAGLDVKQISDAEAANLGFPPGHPRRGTLYVGHPTAKSVYFTTASFHRMVFEHKFAEAVELLMSLGASHIEVEHVHGWSREFSATMATPIASGCLDASASSNSAQTSSILFKADFTNTTQPRLPDNMVWYSHEPNWQNVAKGRLSYGMQEFSLTVTYQDDYGVNAKLGAKAQKAGLDVGGAFGEHMSTTWKITGKFSPLADSTIGAPHHPTHCSV